MSLTIRVLGSVVAESDGEEIDLGPARQQATMVMLAAQAGHVVTMSQLIDGLWGDTPPASARQSVYTYILGLRRALEPDRGSRESPRVLVGATRGYRLHLDERQVDSLNFAEQLAAARQAEQDGDLDLTLRTIHEALTLWRGPALSGVPGPFAEAERARLEELRLTAAETRADALVRLGRSQEVLAELQDLARHHPIRERLSELLMLALLGCDRQAEALKVFEEARRFLVEEFGADPGDGLRRAHHLALHARDGREVQDPAPPRQLPRDLMAFVGRASELIRLKSLLDPRDDEHPHPVVAISGPPGVGKSALAVRIAHEVKDRFPNGQLYVNLRGATPNVARLSIHEIFSRLLRGIGTPDDAIPMEADEAAALWRSGLHGKRLLVLLDDAADLAQVRPFLSAPLGVAVLVTSRESLTVCDDCTQLRLCPLSESESTAMLAKLVDVGRLSTDLDQTARLIHLCDGLPLALRIAGARLADRPDWSVGTLTAKLGDERGRLHQLEVGELAVRSSLAASLGALKGSGRPVDSGAAYMLALLGLLHVPEITAEAAAQLLDSAPMEAERALERLCDAHLLEHGEPGRYHLHDLVRLFAAELLPADDRIAPLTRVLTYYAASARAAAQISDPRRVHSAYPEVPAAGRRFESPEEAYDWLRAEETTLLAAASQAVTDPDDEVARMGVTVGLALWWYQQKAFRVADMISLGARLVSAGERLGDERIEMEAHAHIAVGLHFKGDVAEALRHSERHLQLARQLRDPFNVQRSHGNLATAQWKLGEFHDALHNALAQRKIAREISSEVGERYALLTLGRVYNSLDRPHDALAALEEAAAMSERAGDGMHLAVSGTLRGEALLHLGETARARDLLVRTLEWSRASRLKTAEVTCLVRLAQAHRLLGRSSEARRYAADAVSLAQRMGSAEWLEHATEEQRALGAPSGSG
ncbi:BTAD domain-containing putative transcriptional regulator [Nonomuraea angiospora]|uniref:AfsR/SARP family transcriptional regulator n=1 Tax=Nonomuraea angiospora TaxID=46172 RepID=UPI00332C3478